MKEENKITLQLLGLAFIHINVIAVCVVFFHENEFANILAFGNAMFLVLNGMITAFFIAIRIKMPSIAKKKEDKEGITKEEPCAK